MSIKEAIIKHHSGWDFRNDCPGKPIGLLFFELRSKTGYTFGEPQRIDAFHMDDTPSKGLRRTAYEIKESRSDFLAEIRNPAKRRFAVSMSNEFYFITPPGIVGIEEVPPECGLVENLQKELSEAREKLRIERVSVDSLQSAFGVQCEKTRQTEKELSEALSALAKQTRDCEANRLMLAEARAENERMHKQRYADSEQIVSLAVKLEQAEAALKAKEAAFSSYVDHVERTSVRGDVHAVTLSQLKAKTEECERLTASCKEMEKALEVGCTHPPHAEDCHEGTDLGNGECTCYKQVFIEALANFRCKAIAPEPKEKP